MFNDLKYLIAFLSLLTCAWAAEFTAQADAAVKITDDSKADVSNLVTSYNFTTPDPQVQLLSGFSDFEQWGTWTLGEEASLSISIPKDKLSNQESNSLRDFFLLLNVHGYLPRKDSKIEAEFVLSGINEPYAVTHEFSGENSNRTLFFPLNNIEINDTLNVNVKIKGFSAPAEHSSSTDRRLLGLGFKKISVEAPLRSEYATQDTVFERVIGLGFWCMTKAQINAYFNPTSPCRVTKKGHADLFDWLFLDDYNRFSVALSNNLEDFFEKEDMLVQSNGFYNKKYCMKWCHLWNNFSSSDYADNLEEEKRDLDSAFPPVKEKINYLREKFISAKKQKTLYVISHPKQDLNLETLTRVRDSLSTIREGDQQFVLLFVPHSQTYEGFENIIVREAKHLKELHPVC